MKKYLFQGWFLDGEVFYMLSGEFSDQYIYVPGIEKSQVFSGS
jgi:hypothetical protein